MEGLATLLLSFGAPMLAKAIGGKFGDQMGTLADSTLKTLGQVLGVPGSSAEGIEKIMRGNQDATQSLVQQAERDFVAAMEIIGADLIDYRDMLQADNKQGLLSRIWRPVFALGYTFCFVLMIWTICQAVWSTNIEGINAMINLSGVIIALFTTGAAVLGVYVWGRTGEKKAGVV